ncbi:ATP-dependent Clp protease ATP-binding subunit [Patescibacteria group bacterium]|nr:ATP-dependent Clp protease ATP-binding subunit [Patescibacteria group bacterium]
MELREKKNHLTEYLELEDKQLFWGRNFSFNEIMLRRFSVFINNLKRIILFLICLGGIVALFYHLVMILRQHLPLFGLQAWQSKYLIYFWWSVVAGMYLFYDLNLAARKSFKVIKKSFNKEKIKPEKIKRVDMSDSFTQEALKLVDQAFLSSCRQKRTFNLLYLFNQLLLVPDLKIIFTRLEVSAKSLYRVTKEILKQQSTGKESIDPQIYQVLSQAYFLAYQDRRSKVEAADILEAIAMQDKLIQDILLDFKIDLEEMINAVKWINIQKKLQASYKRYRAKAYFKPKGTMDRAMTALATPVLDSFSEDLTQLARAGYLPLCVARDKEIEEIFHIIEGGKNSVLIVGLPGVGKSNVVEGLANMMVAEEVPKVLQDKRFISLSIAHLVGGATRPNELQERMLIIMNEIIRAGNIILHIDNIHDLVGLSSLGTENVDLSEIFAKFLSKKSVITIATTTPADYKKYLEGKPLAEVLTRVNILEPEDNEAIQMIESKTAYLEGKHHVFFSYDALARTVKLSRRYLPESHLPDKAYRILEEVAATVRAEKGENHLVSGEDVAKIISHRTGILLTEITQEESEKLLNLEKRIHQRIIDQEEAVDLVAAALRRARTELRDIKRPIVNLLFLGPTGVGKTELAKTVAEVYFGAEEKMIRLDMSEYQEQKSLSRLIGDASSGLRGILTEAIRKQPFTLLLLDEIEKAHPDILNVFLQVMDDGRLTDALGRTVDFSSCIIIGTSNAGTQYIQDNIRIGKNIEEIKEDLMLKELKKYFRPEFLNRLDGVVVFKPLSEEDIEKITVLLINKVKKRLEIKGIFLEVTDEAIKELAKEGFDPVFGARPLRRLIQEKVDNALANCLLTKKISRRDIVVFGSSGKIDIKKAKKFQ